MGSKNQIAEKIISMLPSGYRFVDLFGGGGAMTHCAAMSGKYKTVLYNEIDPLVFNLFNDTIKGNNRGRLLHPEFVSHERFDEIKKRDGLVACAWSFGNDFKTYLWSKENETTKGELFKFIVDGKAGSYVSRTFKDIACFVNAKSVNQRYTQLKKYLKAKGASGLEVIQILDRIKRIKSLQDNPKLKNIQTTRGSYEDYVHRNGDVVYCDPPYEGTEEYNVKFDYKKFYDWAYTQEYPIFFSSYEISDKRLKMCFALKKNAIFSSSSNSKKNYEYVYANDAGYELFKRIHK